MLIAGAWAPLAATYYTPISAALCECISPVKPPAHPCVVHSCVLLRTSNVTGSTTGVQCQGAVDHQV